MPRLKQNRSSHFSLGEDVYLLSQSAASLKYHSDDDDDNDDTNDGHADTSNIAAATSSLYASTPKIRSAKVAAIAAIRGGAEPQRPPHHQHHNRWSSVSTVLSSLFGISVSKNEEECDTMRNEKITTIPYQKRRRQRSKRVRIKGIYGFLMHNDFSVEVSHYFCTMYTGLLPEMFHQKSDQQHCI